MEKQYIGDSVYADTEEGMLRIYTDNGSSPENVIYLEPEVLQALIKISFDLYPELRKST